MRKDCDILGSQMRLAGFLLLLAGWVITLAAVVLLAAPAARSAFLLAGLGVEIVGLILVVRAHSPVREDKA